MKMQDVLSIIAHTYTDKHKLIRCNDETYIITDEVGNIEVKFANLSEVYMWARPRRWSML